MASHFSRPCGTHSQSQKNSAQFLPSSLCPLADSAPIIGKRKGGDSPADAVAQARLALLLSIVHDQASLIEIDGARRLQNSVYVLRPLADWHGPIVGTVVSAAFLFAVPERLDQAVELSLKGLPAVVQLRVC